MIRRELAILLALILPAACTQEQRASFSRLFEVQKTITAQFPGSEVNVNLMNGRYLTITIANSAMNTADPATREREARKAATTAVRILNEPLESVRVNFTRHRGGFGFNLINSVASYAFKVDELKSGRSHP